MKAKKILFIRLSSFGDILLLTPVLELIKNKFPKSQIDFVVKNKFKTAIENNPLIANLYPISSFQDIWHLKKTINLKSYDYIFDFHKNPKTLLLTGLFKKNIFRYQKNIIKRFLLVYFKIKYQPISVLNLYLVALKKAKIEIDNSFSPKLSFNYQGKIAPNLLEKLNIKENNFLTIAPGASYETKIWPKEKFSKLIAKLLENNYQILLLGYGKKEEVIGEYITEKINNPKLINLISKLSIYETAYLISKSIGIITNDTGLMHLAQAYQKNTLAIFGCTTEELGFYPYYTNYLALEHKDLKCRPCTHFGKRKCPKKHYKCMNDISVKEVLEAAGKLNLTSKI